MPSYGHKLWALTERMQSQVQCTNVSEIRFLQRIKRVTLLDRMSSSQIRIFLNSSSSCFQNQKISP